MTSDLRIQGEVVVNSEQAESAFNRVGDKASQMANEVATSAGKAGQAVDKIGDGAGASAEKFTRAESRISASIKRATNELELLGKTASQRLEFNIADKGLDAAKFEPALKKLREIEAQALQAQRAASGSLDKMGVSAAQTAAALRGVPAQFTDIITSLQGGQAPLTVFLQQGGQLKDMFGGAGNAAKALGGYVLGLVNPFTLAAAAGVALAVAYNQGSAEADGYRMALVMTGNAAGTTAAQMQQMAGRISSVVGTQGEAAEALAQMASSGRVASQSLEYFSEVAIKFERTTGTAISETVKRFAELGASPVDASRKLNEETNYLTASIYEQIKALKDQGREADAAALAQNTYADALNNRSAQITQNLGAIEGAWKAIKDAAKSGWDAMLNVGRADSLGTQIDNLRAKIAQAKGQDKNRPFSMPWDTPLADLEKQLSYLTEQERMIRRGAEAQAQRTQAEKEAIAAADALQKTQASGMTNQQKMNKALEEYARHIEKLKATNPASVLLSPDAIARGEKAIRDQFSDKGKGSAGIKAVNKDLADQQRIYAELADVSSTYYNDLAAAQEQRAKGKIGEAEYVKYVEELIQKQPFAVSAAKAHAEAIKDEAKAAAASAKALSAWYEVREKESQGLQNQINARREEVALMGLSSEAVAEYTQAKYEQLAAEKEAYAAALESASFYAGEYAEAYKAAAEAARQQAKQLRELGALEVEKVSKGAAKKAADEWQRTADDINRALTDSLLRGFESGKDFAANLRDTVVNMFKTMVLRPTISAIMTPVSLVVNGVIQQGLNAVGLGSGGNLLGLASGASSLYNLGSEAVGWLGLGGGAGSIYSLGTGASGLGLTAGGGLGLSAGGGGLGLTAGAGAGAGSGAVAGASGLGAIPGWGWALAGLAAVATLVGQFDKSGTPHWGAAAEYDGTTLTGGADVFARSGTSGRYTDGAQAGVDAVARAVGDTLNGLGNALGNGGGYSVMTAYSDDSSDDPGFGSLRITRDGQKIRDWEDDRTSKWAPGIFADGEEGWKLYLSAIAKDTRQALQDMDIPGWADKMLSDLGDSVTMEQLAAVVQQIGVINTAFEQLGNNMSMFAGITDELQGALLEAAGGIDALVNSAGAFYQGFYSESERMESLRGQLNTALSGLDLSIDPNLGDDAKAQFRAAVESAMAAGNAELAAALLAISGNFATAADYFEQLSQTAADAAEKAADAAKKAAEKAAQDADKARKDQINSVYDMFRRAVERDRSTLSDQASALGDVINSISSAVDLLKSNARDLYGEVDGTQQMLAAQGMVYIEDALDGVRAGASVADYTGLSDAISAARGGLSSGAYASEFDRQRDTLVLAGQLSELAEAGGEQLSVQERQLRAINEQIEYLDRLAQRADDMVNGTAALTGTVESYFNQLMSLLGVQGSTSAPSTPNTEYGGVQGGTAAKPWQYGQGYAGEPTRFGVEYDFGAGLGGRGWHDVTDRAQIEKLTGLRAMLQAEYGSGSAEDLARVADNAKAMGATMGDIASALGFWREDIVKMFAGVGIPAFAVGTNYVPRDMVAKIHEGEAIVPKAFNPWAGGGGMQINTARLEALVEKLTEENQRQAGEIVRLNLRVAKVLERWDGDGMPNARVEAAV